MNELIDFSYLKFDKDSNSGSDEKYNDLYNNEWYMLNSELRYHPMRKIQFRLVMKALPPQSFSAARFQVFSV